MYIPHHFDESQIDVMHDLIRAYPLATLVTLGADGIAADHIPMLLSPTPLSYGLLQGHVARANPVWKDARGDIETLAVFHGPEAYVSPSWYATKTQTGKVVPTWNYAVVHAYGILRVIDDPAWLRAQIERLTDTHESSFSKPWQVSDAPGAFIDKQITAIVGIELVITRLLGKWKMSQNRSDADRDGVIHGLERRDDAGTSDAAALIPAGTASTPIPPGGPMIAPVAS